MNQNPILNLLSQGQWGQQLLTILCALAMSLPLKAQASDCHNMIVESAKTYFQRAFCYSQNQEYQKALVDYSVAIELDKTNRNARYNRGLILAKHLGQYDEALTDFNELLQRNPRDTEALFQRGNIYFQLGRKNQALDNYVKAVNINPQLGDAFFNIGIIYHRQKKNDEALKNLKRAKDIFAEQGNLNKFNQANNAIMDLLNP